MDLTLVPPPYSYLFPFIVTSSSDYIFFQFLAPSFFGSTMQHFPILNNYIFPQRWLLFLTQMSVSLSKHMMRGERRGQIDGITNYIYRKKIPTLTTPSYTNFEQHTLTSLHAFNTHKLACKQKKGPSVTPNPTEFCWSVTLSHDLWLNVTMIYLFYFSFPCL